MDLEKYIIDCPSCGKVEGYIQPQQEDYEEESGVGDVDEETVEETFESKGHPVEKVRCPRCGTWLAANRAGPEADKTGPA